MQRAGSDIAKLLILWPILYFLVIGAMYVTIEVYARPQLEGLAPGSLGAAHR